MVSLGRCWMSSVFQYEHEWAVKEATCVAQCGRDRRLPGTKWQIQEPQDQPGLNPKGPRFPKAVSPKTNGVVERIQETQDHPGLNPKGPRFPKRVTCPPPMRYLSHTLDECFRLCTIGVFTHWGPV